MPLMKYKTMGRDTHRYGRVALSMDANPFQKKVFITVLEGRHLNGGFQNTDVVRPLYVEVRVQLLPHKNPELVTKSLCGRRPKQSNYKVATLVHHTTGNPEFHEEFVLDLSEAWPALGAFRLYLSVMCSERIGSELMFSGSTSWSMEELFEHTEESRPRWWWLQAQNVGLFKNEAVEQKVVTSDSLKLKPDVIISGRVPELANAKINGVYLWQLEECSGRPTYKHSDQPLWIYYHEKRGAWCIADAVKSIAPHAYVDDDQRTPDRCNGPWHVFNRGRQRKSVDAVPDPKVKGRYEPDLAVECLRKSVLGATQPQSEKARHICRLIAAQEEFLVVLKSLRVYRAELDNVILVDDYPGGGDALFKSLNNLEDASQEFLDRLTHGFAADPRCEEPLGQLLTHAAQRLRNPTIDFCDDLTTKVEVVSKYPIESTTSTNTFDKEDIIKAMEQPFLHVQRYPHFVNSIMKVSEVEMSASVALDLQMMRDARDYMQHTVVLVMKACGGDSAKLKTQSKDGHIIRPTVSPDAPPWFHGVMPKQESIDLIAGRSDGTFLIRQRPDNHTCFAMELIHRGQVTHHHITRETNGTFAINSISFGDVISITEMVDKLRVPQPKWPVRIKSFVPRKGVSAAVVAAELEKTARLLQAVNVDPDAIAEINPNATFGVQVSETLSGELNDKIDAFGQMVNEEVLDFPSQVVELPFGPAGLGLSFVGPKTDDARSHGVFLTKTNAGSVAARAKPLRIGMRVLNVDAVDCRNVTRIELYHYIKSRPHGTIVFNLKFDPDGFARYDGGRLQAQVRADRLRRKEILHGVDSHEVEKQSATKIQAAFRGMQSRRESAAYLRQVKADRNDQESTTLQFIRVKPESIDDGYDTKIIGLQVHTTLGSGTVRFVGFMQSTEPKQPVVGVELASRNGLNDGTSRGFRYFECEQGFGALMRPKHVALPKHHNAALKIQANFRGMKARTSSQLAIEAKRKAKRNEVYVFEEGTAVPLKALLKGGFPLHLVGSEVSTPLGTGTLRFIGFLQHVDPHRPCLGVELSSPLGSNDGSVQGFRYFKCEPDYGALLSPKHVTVPEVAAATQIQAGFRGMKARKESKLRREQAAQESAAVKIQAGFRGMQARRFSREIREDPSKRESRPPSESVKTVATKAVPEHGLQLSTIGMQVDTDLGTGVVRFVGYHPRDRRPRIGVELDEPNGLSNGTMNGFEFFACEQNRGAVLKVPAVNLDSIRPRPAPKHPKQTITLIKPENGKLGLKFVGPKDEEDRLRRPGNYVKAVQPGSAADTAADVLREGVRLIRVNGKSMNNTVKADVARALSEWVNGENVLTVRYDPEGYAAYDHGELLRRGPEAPQEEVEAATILQSGFRGMQARRRASAIREEKAAEAAAAQEAEEARIREAARVAEEAALAEALANAAADAEKAEAEAEARRRKSEKKKAVAAATKPTELSEREAAAKEAMEMLAASKVTEMANGADSFHLTVNKAGGKLGCSLKPIPGGDGALISRIEPGGAAERSGLISGMVVLSANGTVLAGMAKADFANIMKGSDTFDFVISATTASVSSMPKSPTSTKKTSTSESGPTRKDSDKSEAKPVEPKKDGVNKKSGSVKKSGSKKASGKSSGKGSGKGSQKASMSNEPPPSSDAPQKKCAYVSGNGKNCSRSVRGSGVYCAGHQCPTCSKSKSSQSPGCKACIQAGKVTDSQATTPAKQSTSTKARTVEPSKKARNTSAPHAPPSSTSSNDKYEGWGRLQMIKECRARNIDYGDAKNAEELKQLLVNADGN